MSALAKTEQLIATITLTPEELRTANELLQRQTLLSDRFEGEELFEKTGKFADGFEADLNIYNDEGGPWAEIVLFDQNGGNVTQTDALGEPIEAGAGALFCVDGLEYVLMIEVAGEGA